MKTALFGQEQPAGKVLICGVCRDIEKAVPNTIRQIEELGSRFEDYAVIIYENNSRDKTAERIAEWAQTNPYVTFVTEYLPPDQLSPNRVQRISRARNIVLDIARSAEYDDFTYLIMADLDFMTPWPIEAIVESTLMTEEWDCISANGTFQNGSYYWDRYAFRDADYPFGPEVIGSSWRKQLYKTWFSLQPGALKPVYSAFGGLAIYKKAAILQFSYSGTATPELEHYYGQILRSLPYTNAHLQFYLQMHRIHFNDQLHSGPFRFVSYPKDYRSLEACEHLTLHAAMALQGHGKFFINPQMEMRYSH